MAHDDQGVAVLHKSGRVIRFFMNMICAAMSSRFFHDELKARAFRRQGVFHGTNLDCHATRFVEILAFRVAQRLGTVSGWEVAQMKLMVSLSVITYPSWH